MSDGPTHFMNDTIHLVSKGLKVPHHSTFPYCLWSNSAVVILGKELVRTCPAILSELRMQPEEWPDILPLIQSALNNTSSRHHRNIAPITAFLGEVPTHPIRTFLRTETITAITVDDSQSERLIKVDALKRRMPTSIQWFRSLSLHISRSPAFPLPAASFHSALQDILSWLHANISQPTRNFFRWRGPRRIVKSISDYIYQVEDLRTGPADDIHCVRLQFYHDPILHQEATMSHVLFSKTGTIVQRLMRIFVNDDNLLVQVRWKVLPDSEDTYEPIAVMHNDVPTLFQKLLFRQSTPRTLADRAQRQLRL